MTITEEKNLTGWHKILGKFIDFLSSDKIGITFHLQLNAHVITFGT